MGNKSKFFGVATGHETGICEPWEECERQFFELAYANRRLMGSKSKFYAVATGHEPGIYESWEECERQVKGFKGACFKSFLSKAQAEDYMKEKSSKVSTGASKHLMANPAAKIKSADPQIERKVCRESFSHQVYRLLNFRAAEIDMNGTFSLYLECNCLGAVLADKGVGLPPGEQFLLMPN